MDLITPPAIMAGTEPVPAGASRMAAPMAESARPSGKVVRASRTGEHRPRRPAAAGQPTPEPLPSPGQPALDRPHGTSQVPRRLLVGAALQVAEHHRDAVPLWQSVELLVHDGRHLGVARPSPRGSEPRPSTAPRSTARRARSASRTSADRRPVGDPVQPGADRVADPERTPSTGQDQERRLKRVAGVVLVAQDGQAGAQDHRTVPIDQGRERHLSVVTAPCREASPATRPSVRPTAVPARSRVRRPCRPVASRWAVTDASLSLPHLDSYPSKATPILRRSNFLSKDLSGAGSRTVLATGTSGRGRRPRTHRGCARSAARHAHPARRSRRCRTGCGRRASGASGGSAARRG